MPWLHVIWDSFSRDGNLAHVESHGLTADDIEQVLCDPEDTGISRTTGWPIAFGHIDDGRLICVVYQQIDEITVMPITAFEIEEQLMRRRVRRISRRMTPKELKQHRVIRAEIEKEKQELETLGRRLLARQARLREALAALKATRESLGLSLQEIGARTGIGKANLSRLENARNPNPKIDTLARYAEALGKDMVLSFKSPQRRPAKEA